MPFKYGAGGRYHSREAVTRKGGAAYLPPVHMQCENAAVQPKEQSDTGLCGVTF